MKFKKIIGNTFILISFFGFVACSPSKKEDISFSDNSWGSCPPPPPGFTSCAQWKRFSENEKARQEKLEEEGRKIDAKVKKEWGL